MAKFAVSLCALLVVLASIGETKKPCCTQFHADPLPLKKLCGYTVDRGLSCRLNAITFSTVKNRIICADPKQPWVQNAMEFIKNQIVSGNTAPMCRKNRK